MSSWKQTQLDHKLRSKIISVINKYIDDRNDYSNVDIRTLMNPILDRDPMVSKFIERMVAEIMNYDSKYSFLNTQSYIKNIFKYYLLSIFHYILMLMHYVMYKISRLDYYNCFKNINEVIHIVDPMLLIKKNVNNDGFKELYFDGLYETLYKKRKNYYILTVLTNEKPWRITEYYSSYNILADIKYNYVTEFALLKIIDYMKIFIFIITYPFLIIQINKINIHKRYDEIFKDEFKRNMSSVSFRNYTMYLVGKRIGQLSSNKINLISWYENIPRNKALYRGIREKSSKSYIYGCQFFLPFNFWMHIHPIQSDYRLNTVPDKILVNGKSFCQSDNSRYTIGLSPRYNYLFKTKEKVRTSYKSSPILVLLTIHVEDSINIIKIVKESLIDKENRILIKLHPNHLVSEPANFNYPSNWEHTDDSLSDLCKRCTLILSSGSSGSILEAATMGCTVISINRDDNLSFNVMPELGHGEIWDFAFDSNELSEKCNKLLQYRKNNEHSIKEISNAYKDHYFREANEQRYCEIFQL